MAQSAGDFKLSGMAITFTFIAATLLVATGIITFFYGAWEVLFGGVERDTETFITMSARTWGVVHVALGTLLGLAGGNLFVGKAWARVFAIGIAALMILAAIGSMPENPVFSGFLIVLNATIIWALAFHGEDIKTITT